MSYSMGEVEAHCRKAARGAGFSWGEAEEAGQAVRRLSAAGLPGADALLAYLTAREAGLLEAHRCPIKLGCSLLDRGQRPIAECHTPLLLLPFVGLVAQDIGSALALRGLFFHGVAGPDGALHVVRGALEDEAMDVVPSDARDAALVWRATCPVQTYEALNTFCMRTYAPETDERRNAGAGAGDDGND